MTGYENCSASLDPWLSSRHCDELNGVESKPTRKTNRTENIIKLSSVG